MRDRTHEGSWAWKQGENNERLIAFQEDRSPPGEPTASGRDGVEIGYFGGSCFRLVTPAGISVLLDPWRNPPWGNWDWYLYDFPAMAVDVAISTHAHFDHDGLHAVSASTVLDRPVGTWSFADLSVTGIADKHVSETGHNAYDWAEMTRRLTGMKTRPPDNCRSFDNALVIVETGGLRLLHWGDNRPDPPDAVWDRIGPVDVAFLPVDGSWHVLSEAQVDAVAARLGAKVVIPHHYGIWDLTTRGSTLLPPDSWVRRQPDARWIEGGTVRLTAAEIAGKRGAVLCFGNDVAFPKPIGARPGTGA